jgi:hypothetical protein
MRLQGWQVHKKGRGRRWRKTKKDFHMIRNYLSLSSLRKSTYFH